MTIHDIVSDENVGSAEWHLDIASQLKKLSGSVEEVAHYKDLAEIHDGIGKVMAYAKKT